MEGVRVSGIDAQCSVQVVWQYFDNRGAAVKAIYYPLLNNDAVVIFKTPAGTTEVLTRNHEKWKVSPLPNQVFSQQRVWVESDLAMLIQATGAYEDALRNMGQLDVTVDSKTQELILCGQPYQIEWAWNYLSSLRDNQFHIARSLQTGTATVSGLSNGSADLAYGSSRHDRVHSPRLSGDSSKHQREKPSTKEITDVASLRLESVTRTHREISPRSPEPYDGVPDDRTLRPETLREKEALLASMTLLSMLRDEHTDRHDARERRRRQDDANETFNKFASLPTSSNAAHIDPLRHTDSPSRHNSGRGGLHGSARPGQTDLERLEAEHKLERQSLENRESRADYHQGATGGYQSLQSDILRQREHGEAGEERGRSRVRSNLSSSHGAAAAASELSPYLMSKASMELSQKEFQVGRRLKLKIYMDDITKTKTEAVVNAANWELKNIGGVAGALAKAAGPEMATDCAKLVKQHGHLVTAQVVKTKAYGKLSHMKYVLHTVGPIYIESDTERSVFELAMTFYNCLELAEKLDLRTLTFPFISTGIFRMPIEHCVLSLVTAVQLLAEWQQTEGSTSVQEIHFVNNDINVVCEAIIMAQQRLNLETVESAKERLEGGKKLYGKYVYPYCQGLSSLSSSPHLDSERYATWDTSQLRRGGTERADDVRGSSRRTPRVTATSYDPGSTGEFRSLPQFGIGSDSRHRSGSLDRGFKTKAAGGSGTQPHRTTTTTTGGGGSLSVTRDPSPRPQARPRSNSLTSSGKSVGTATAAATAAATAKGSSGGGGRPQQPVIKKSLAGSTSTKTTGLAKRLASKKSGGHSGGRTTGGGGGDYSGNDTDTASAAGSEMEEADGGCIICLEPLRQARKLLCGHSFCSSCIDPAFAVNPRCPRCKALFTIPTGDQPKDGTMTYTFSSHSDLPGHKNAGIIVIKYVFPTGKQLACHPKPGQPYEGVHHTAYLPDNVEGNEVLKMLRKAFDHRLVFTIGSRGNIVWNGIHHKTSKTGGPAEDSYPDSTYLRRVKEELRAKGITSP